MTTLTEQRISDLLTKRNISFIKEISIKRLAELRPSLLTNQMLNNKRFDFYLPDYNAIIEFDGEQHFNVNNYFNVNQFNLLRYQISDYDKINFCISNKIRMVRLQWLTTEDDLYEALNLLLTSDKFQLILINNNHELTVSSDRSLIDHPDSTTYYLENKFNKLINNLSLNYNMSYDEQTDTITINDEVIYNYFDQLDLTRDILYYPLQELYSNYLAYCQSNNLPIVNKVLFKSYLESLYQLTFAELLSTDLNCNSINANKLSKSNNPILFKQVALLFLPISKQLTL